MQILYYFRVCCRTGTWEFFSCAGFQGAISAVAVDRLWFRYAAGDAVWVLADKSQQRSFRPKQRFLSHYTSTTNARISWLRCHNQLIEQIENFFMFYAFHALSLLVGLQLKLCWEWWCILTNHPHSHVVLPHFRFPISICFNTVAVSMIVCWTSNANESCLLTIEYLTNFWTRMNQQQWWLKHTQQPQQLRLSEEDTCLQEAVARRSLQHINTNSVSVP